MAGQDSSKLLLMLVAGAALAGVTWWRPILGLYVYLASVGLDYLLGLAGFSTGGLLSVGQGMLVILAMISFIKWQRQGGGFPVPVKTLLWRIGLFLLAIWTSTFLGIWPENSLFKSLVLTATAFIPFVLYALIDRPDKLQSLMWAIGLGVALSAVIGCLQYAGVLQTINSEQRESASDTRGVVYEYRANGGGAEEGKRYAGPTNNANGFGLVLMGGIPALFYLATSRRSFAQKAVAVASLGVCGFALLLTMSRTHIIGFLLFLVLMTVFGQAGSWLKRMVYWLLGLAFLGVFIFTLSRLDGVQDRLMAGIENGGDNSSDTRLGVMKGGLLAWVENPLFGVGLNNTEVAGYNDTGNASHDIISTLFGELGGFGVFAFAWLLKQSFKLGVPAEVVDPDVGELRPINFLVKASLAVVLISGFGDPTIDSRSLWIWIGVCAVLCRLSQRKSVEAKESEMELQLALKPSV
jgi:uncharacterized membrane protein YuzA (DUF378 family)